jgi:hypothetical protein
MPLDLPAIEAQMQDEAGKALNLTPLLCRSAVRQFLLDAGKQHRPFNKFSRVSEDTLIAANAMLRAWCVSRVKSAPSKGVTL